MRKEWLLICLTFLVLTISVNAIDYPKIVPYVNDFAHTLTQQQIDALNQKCAQIEHDTSYEIAIVTVTSTQGDGRVDYANRIGEENGVGKKDTSNGVIVLWSLDNEKGGAIAPGRGAETFLNDAKVGEIGRASRPFFDKADYYGGFNQILIDLETTIKNRDVTANKTATNSKSDLGLDTNSWIMIGVIFLVIIIFIIIKSGTSGRWSSSSGGIFSGGSSGGGGGRGFGGGSFGGGGAGFVW